MWRAWMIFWTFVLGLGAVSALGLVGFAVVERDWQTAGMMTLFGLGLAWGARACRLDWRRENQRRAEARRS